MENGPMGKARAVIFDYGGVMRREDPADWDKIASKFGLPRGKAWTAFHDAPEYLRSRVGIISAQDLRAAVVRGIGLRIGPEAAERLFAEIEEQDRTFPLVDPEMDALLDRLRGRVRLGLLSNAAKGDHARFVERGIAQRFDDVVCSGDVGFAKPDAKVYRLAADRLEVDPSKCAFVDDMERNVEGARAVGMAAHLHHWSRPADLERFLQEVGALRH